MGRLDPQGSLLSVEVVHADRLSQTGFYALLRRHRDRLVSDDMFCHMYSDRGRRSVPPSRMMLGLLLAAHDDVSDREAERRTKVDEDWRAVMGMRTDDGGIGDRTFGLFRARLVLHEADREMFRRVLRLAGELGVLSERKVAVVDSTAVAGAAAARSARGVVVSQMRAVATLLGDDVLTEAVEAADGYYSDARVGDAGTKGEALRDLLGLARRVADVAETSAMRDTEAVRLLRLLIDQHPGPGGSAPSGGANTSSGKGGGSEKTEGGGGSGPRGLVRSHVDPEARFGRTSGGRAYFGWKCHQVTDPDSELVVAMAVGPGNQPDPEPLAGLVSQARQVMDIAQVVGDTAYGDAEVRIMMGNDGIEMVAPVPPAPNGASGYPKDRFRFAGDLSAATCPQEVSTHSYETIKDNKGRPLRRFRFPAGACGSCPVRSECVSGKGPRTVRAHPHETVIAQARERLEDPEVAAAQRLRPTVERKMDHLKDRGIRKTRYRGQRKVLLAAHLAGIITNLTRINNLGALDRDTAAA